MDESLEKSEEFIQADLDFHTALAEATRNDIFLIMIHPVIDLLQDARRLSVKTRGASSRAQAYHHEIYNHVVAGLPNEASEAMKAHLDQTWCEILANIEENGTEP
jgi:GntR family transcriptional repressor for pyruvate dehydrogenase complex